MKKVLFLLIIAVAVFSDLAAASFTKGNLTAEIETSYAPRGIIRGWINISLQDEPADSLISGNFGGSIKLIDFLYENDADYGCVPSNCNENYIASNGQQNKSFFLRQGQEKIISLVARGSVSSINQVSFDVSAKNPSSCINPLKIDLLNDGGIEWKSNKFTSSFLCTYGGGRGCFNPEGAGKIAIDSVPYCEKIGLVESGKFILGAWVERGATPWQDGLLKMELYDLNDEKKRECNLPQPDVSGSEVSCVVNYSNERLQDYHVCVRATQLTDYKTKIESNNSCGFYGEPPGPSEKHDYYIFAKAAKFEDTGKFSINQSEYSSQGNSGELKDYVFSYINEKYSRNCLNGCSIPIKFKAYENTNITISNLILGYSTGSGHGSSDLMYDTGSEKAKVNSEFLILDLSMANISVPSDYGNQTFELYLGSERIARVSIYVQNLPEIETVFPTSVSAAVPTKFGTRIRSVANRSIAKYTWNFGDGTEETADTGTIVHTYSAIGSYTLELNVEDSSGASASKEFTISVISPKKIANSTLKNYRGKITALKSSILNFSMYCRTMIENQIGLSELDSELAKLERGYETALTEQDYINIMGNLSELEIPDSIDVSESASGGYMIAAEEINPSFLAMMSGEETEEPEIYKEAIGAWFNENIEMNAESRVYSARYENRSEPLASVIKLKIKPKQDFSRDAYLIIKREYSELKFSEDYSERAVGEATGIKFSGLLQGEEKTLEFAAEGRESAEEMGIYISPAFSQLPEQGVIGVCNLNEKCEKDRGENWKNCRNDCLPWGRIVLYLALLLFAAFAVYIILQEWYKRRYESHLFRDRNELFNLISFINNAVNRGLNKDEIFRKLKNEGWSSEKITYAYKKFRGERTGMLEIPIFRGFERREIEREIQKRQWMAR